MATPVIYTIGHSDRTLAAFLALLNEAGIRTLVDVRARPQSSRHPHFDEAALRQGAEAVGLVYHWAGRQLGGLRTPRPDSPHTALADEGLRGYADYMDGEPFQRAAVQLVNLAGRAPTAVLCAERLPEHCHRGLLADYLTLQGVAVTHLIEPGVRQPHVLSPAVRRESARLVYDRHVSGTLDLD